MEQSNKAAAMWVDFTRDIVLDSQRHEDSISWAVVEGDSYSTTEMSYFQQVARKNAATSLQGTLWKFKPTISSGLNISNVEFVFVNYFNSENTVGGLSYTAEPAVLSLVNASGFEEDFPTTVAGNWPLIVPEQWVNYGPICFTAGSNLENQDLISWVNENCIFVGTGDGKDEIILSSYSEEHLPSDVVRYDVRLMSDADIVVSGLLNQGASGLHKGDYVLLYKVGGSLANSYIIGKSGSSPTGGAISSSSSSGSKTTTTILPETPTINPDPIYSCTFLTYVQPQSGSTIEWLLKNNGSDTYFAAKATLSVGDTTLEIGVWWKGGQTFDFGDTYGSIYRAYDELTSIPLNSDVPTSWGSNYWLSAFHNPVSAVVASALTALRWLMPGPQDELLVAEQSPPSEVASTYQGDYSYQVVSVIRNIGRTGGIT